MRTFFIMEGGDSEFANFTLPTLKAFFEAHVSGNKQQLAARAIGCPKTQFFLRTRDLLVHGQPKNEAKTLLLFFQPSITFPRKFLQLQQYWHLYCFAILGSTFTVVHSVKQRLLRNQPGSDAATSCDFLPERLQRAFTHANQLH